MALAMYVMGSLGINSHVSQITTDTASSIGGGANGGNGGVCVDKKHVLTRLILHKARGACVDRVLVLNNLILPEYYTCVNTSIVFYGIFVIGLTDSAENTLYIRYSHLEARLV